MDAPPDPRSRWRLARAGPGVSTPLGWLALLGGGLCLGLRHRHLRRAERLGRDLFEHAPEGILIAGSHGRYTDANRAACRMLGYRREELVGRHIHELIAPADAPKLAASMARMRSGRPDLIECDLRRKDGRYLPVEICAKRLPDGCWHGFVRDISDRRRMEAALRERDKRLREAAIVFDSAKEGVVVTDPDANILRVNRAYSAITGYAPEEVVGRNPRLHQSGRHDQAFYAHLWDSLINSGHWQGEIWNRRKNGEIYPAWSTITAVHDEAGRLINFVALLSDISVVKQSEQRMRDLAHQDTLTKLPNRLLFDARLEQALERARRHSQRVALLFLDLDRFKQINDTFGHTGGDQLLQAVAARLRDSVRAEDTVARLGGDEFTVIMEELKEPADAARLARKLIEQVRRPARIEGREVRSSTSVGIALYPEDAVSPAELVRAADAAMYRAKMRGRGTFEFYTPEVTPNASAVQREEREERERHHRPRH